jgi:hypothetical protein
MLTVATVVSLAAPIVDVAANVASVTMHVVDLRRGAHQTLAVHRQKMAGATGDGEYIGFDRAHMWGRT